MSEKKGEEHMSGDHTKYCGTAEVPKREWVGLEAQNLLKRLDLIKDSDPFNKRILNDCFTTIQQLSIKLDALEKQLYEFAGTEQKL